MGFVLGIPDGDLQQRHELDIYRLDGSPVATGIKLPGITGGRMVVADAGHGRLVAVGQKTWEPGSETMAWQVSLTGLEN